MSIRIQKSKCAGCGRCIEACPGNLIKKDKENKAFIRQVRDCWGCTSCIKECRHDAIRFFLGADVGGRGASMVVSEKTDISTWTVEKPDGTKITIQVNKKDADFDFAVDFGFSVGVTVRVFGAGGPAASVPWTFENIQTATIHAVNTICPVLHFFVNIIPFCSNTYIPGSISGHERISPEIISS